MISLITFDQIVLRILKCLDIHGKKSHRFYPLETNFFKTNESDITGKILYPVYLDKVFVLILSE